MLEKVKANLGITGTYQNATIQGWIDEVKQYLIDGGVDEEVADSEYSTGIITVGVKDLWNYGSGDGKLSPYFYQRAIQLASKSTKIKSELQELKERVTALEDRVDEHDELFEELAGENDD